MEIKNKELELNLQVLLHKDIKKIEQKDLDNINDITLNAKDVQDNIITNDLDDLKLFKNLQTCTIRNYEITQENLKMLKNINDIEELIIYNCKFDEDIFLDIKAKKLQFISCNNLNVGKLISNYNINTVFILHCLKLKIGDIENIKNIYFDENYITKDILKDLLKSNIKNITLNNCDFQLFTNKYLKGLQQEKNVIISNKNKIM